MSRTPSNRSLWLALILPLVNVWPSVGVAQEPGLYLYQIEVAGEVAPTQASGPLNLNVSVGDVAPLVQNLEMTTVKFRVRADKKLAIVLDGKDHFESDLEGGFVRNSWVVDYEESPVQVVLEELWQERTLQQLNPVAITRFTYDTIVDKNYRNGFNIASQVARTKEGDCTEHAVLNAALLRANDYRARIVLGVLLEVSGGQLKAYGHAWNEVHFDGAWRLLDATRGHPDGHRRLFYLPLRILTNEGPGYAKGLMDFIQVRPDRLELKAPRT
ncbi:MAG: transglutaminase domain-containing protein [Pseudomonadota bacterium]